MSNFDFFKAGFILSISISIMSCKDDSNYQSAYEELLRSNEIQRKAHLTNDATLLANEIADSMVYIQNGMIRIASNTEIKTRFEAYFKQMKYTSWDDVQPPMIKISKDGSMATVAVQKLIDTQQMDSLTNLGEHEYTLFAWSAQFKLINGTWKMTANTSTSKTLTQEEAFKLPIHLSEEYAVINELDLIPEGFAFDNTTQTAYVSSTYKQKIVALHPDGTYADFKSEKEDGLWSTVGMEVDEINQKLWVISSNAHEVLPMKYPDPKTEWSSKIFEYDLATGQLVKTYEPKISGRFFFNDLCI